MFLMLLRACIAVYLHTSKSCLFHIAPRRYLEKGGLKKSTPYPGDHFDFLVVVAYGTDPGIAPYYLVP